MSQGLTADTIPETPQSTTRPATLVAFMDGLFDQVGETDDEPGLFETPPGSGGSAEFTSPMLSEIVASNSLPSSSAESLAVPFSDVGGVTTLDGDPPPDRDPPNEPPDFNPNTVEFEINENNQPGAVIGTVTAVDPEGEDLTYTIDATSHPYWFSVNSQTGQITANISLNHETDEYPSLSVKATDPAGGTDIINVTVHVLDVNEPPWAQSHVVFTQEDVPKDVNVLLCAGDPEGDPLTIELVGSVEHGTTAILDGGTPNDPSDDKVRFTPELNFNGIGKFEFRVSDGSLTSETEPVWVHVTPVNDPPVLSLEDQQTAEGKRVNVALDFSDSDNVRGDLTFTAQGLPAGLAVSATGIVTGRIHYDQQGSHTVTVTVTDPEGGQDTGWFNWVVDDRRFATLTATEMRRTASYSEIITVATSNSVTVSGLSTEVLYLNQGIFELSVGADPVVPMPELSDVLFYVDQGATPSNGTMAQGPEISLPQTTFGSGARHTVMVGLDLNLDGTLQTGEISHLLYAAWLVYLGGGNVEARRISGPLPAESRFPVQSGERFEEAISGFEFTLVALGSYGQHSLIRYNVREDGFLTNNPLLFGGTGPTFEIAFPSTGTERSLFVEFYIDANDNRTRESNENFATVSQTFIVQPLHVINVTVEYSDVIVSGR